MQQLYERYSDSLEILAFPCNDFGQQEPGTNEEIREFASEHMGATFPILPKLDCQHNDQTHPLYKFLKESISDGANGNALKWNYVKFLCDKNGRPIKRYGPKDFPLSFENDIKLLIETGKVE